MADHIVYVCISLSGTNGYADSTAGENVTSASSTISMTGATTTADDRAPCAFSAGAIDSDSFEGSTTWTASDPDVTSEAFLWWTNTTTGVGGGITSGGGYLAVAGPSGTFDSTWSAATKQSNISFAIYGPAPATYDQTKAAGTNSVVVTEPLWGSGYKFLLLVETANELVDTPSGWTLIGTVGQGTAGASGSTRIYAFWTDTWISTTLTISEAAPEIPKPVYPDPTRRKPNLALTVAACVVPFVAAIADLESVLSWQPDYPDRHMVPRRPVNTGGAFAPSPDPLPNPLTPLAWAPEYPDQVWRKLRQPHLISGVFKPVDAITGRYRSDASGGGTSGTSDRTVAITPIVGELICVFVSLSGNTNTAMTATDDRGGTYYLAGTALWGTSANIGAVFVRNALAGPGNFLHTITVNSGSNTAGALIAINVTGMQRAGRNAVRSFGSQANQSASTTPAPALNQNALFENPTYASVASGDTTTTPPSLWTERLDVNQTIPTTAVELVTRDFGFEGTTITYGATQSTTYASFALELDGRPYVQTDWLPIYPDLARRPAPRPHGGMVQPPYDTSSPAGPMMMEWIPVYPDILRPAKRNPFGGATFENVTTQDVNLDWLRQPLDPVRRVRITHVGDIAEPIDSDGDEVVTLGWIPSYPDILRPVRRSPITFLAWTPSDEIDVPRLSWAPDYPDSARRAYPPRIAAGAFNPGRDELDVKYLSWSPDYPDLPGRGKRRNPFGGTFATPSDELDVPRLSWQPEYPDFARRAPPRIQGGSFNPGRDELDVPYLAWSPEFADRAPGHRPRPHGGLTAPPSDTNAGPLCWAPSYPDFARRAPPRIQGGMFAPGRDELDVEYLSWSPKYQDFALGPLPRLTGGLTEPPSDTNAGPLTWSPTYPDFARRAPPRITAGMFAPGRDELDVPYLSWSPEFPDFARKAPPRLEGGLTAPGRDELDVEYLSWQPDYPDRISVRHPTERLEAFETLLDLSEPVLPALSWQPVYPDAVRRTAPRPQGGTVAPPSDTSNIPYLSWGPTYPDRIPRRHQAERLDAFETLLDFRAPDLSWQPSFPDFARGHRPRLEGGRFASPFDTSNVPYLSWAPSYPDAIARLHQAERLETFECLLDLRAPDLAWHPIYPDFAKGHRPRLEGGLFAPPNDRSNVPYLSWEPTFPDIARGPAPTPEGGLFAPPSEPATVPYLAWSPSYPERVARRHQVERLEVFDVARDTEAVPLSWSPDYPDRVPAARRATNEGGLFATQYFDPEPPLDWLTVYPDFARQARRYPFGLLVEPIDVPVVGESTTAPSYAETADSRSKVSLTESCSRSIAEGESVASTSEDRSKVSTVHSSSRVNAIGESVASTNDNRSIATVVNSHSKVDDMGYNIKVGDLDPPIRATLKDQDNTAVNITGGTVAFRWRKKGTSTWTSGSASITLASAGTVYYRFTTGQTDVAGTYESEWVVTTSGNPRTYPSDGFELFYINDD